MWNQFLNQYKSQHKFDNTPVIVVGNKHTGKRSVLDELFEISKTTLYHKKTPGSIKMRLKEVTPIINYAYLNVMNLADPDYRTHAKLELYIIEDKYKMETFSQLYATKLLKNAIFVIMLDFTNPWSFLDDIDGWISFLRELQKNAGLEISQLDEMASKLEKCYKEYKEPEFDESGKLKREFGSLPKQEDTSQIDIPLPDGVLTKNIRMPLILCVNKCDLQSAVLRSQSAYKIQFILYHLRKVCIEYGGTLIYTSLQNSVSMSILYEYILHRAYNMPLKYKAETVSEQSIFLPFGYDNPTLLEDSVLKMDMNKPYSQVIAAPVHKNVTEKEVVVQEDAEFFEKSASVSSSISSTVDNDKTVSSSSGTANRSTQVTQFFKNLLNSKSVNSASQGVSDEQRRNQAQNALFRHTNMQAGLNKEQK